MWCIQLKNKDSDVLLRYIGSLNVIALCFNAPLKDAYKFYDKKSARACLYLLTGNFGDIMFNNDYDVVYEVIELPSN